MCGGIVDSTSSLLSEHFSNKLISHLHNQSFPHVLSQGAEELAIELHRRRAFAPFGAPGTFDGGSVFARPVSSSPESHLDWSLARLDPDASLSDVVSSVDRQVIAPVMRRAVTVD